MYAGPAEQGTQVPLPHASGQQALSIEPAHRGSTGPQMEQSKAMSQENLPPEAVSPAGQAPQAHAGSSSKPQQTLEEMTAWLDAQLAKASGLSLQKEHIVSRVAGALPNLQAAL